MIDQYHPAPSPEEQVAQQHKALEALRQNPGTPVSLAEMGPQEIAFNTLAPLATEGEYHKIASLILGPPAEGEQVPSVDVWILVDENGIAQPGNAFASRGGIDAPAILRASKDAGDGSWAKSIVPIGQSLVIGRAHKGALGNNMTDIFELDQAVSRQHVTIEDIGHGLIINDLSSLGTSLEATPAPRDSELIMPTVEVDSIIGIGAQPAETAPVESQLPAPTTAHETKAPDIQLRAMQELRESWKLPEEATVENAVRRIDLTMESVQELQSHCSTDSNMQRMLSALKQRLQATYSGRGLVHYNGGDIETLGRELSRFSRKIVDLESDRQTLMSPRARRDLSSTRNNIDHILYRLREAAPQGGMVRGEAAQDALIALGGLDNMQEPIGRINHELEQKRIDLLGAAAALVEQASETEAFAGLHIAEMAEMLRSEGVNDAVVEVAAGTMERYINDAIKNGSLKFPLRVVNNENASRNGGPRASHEANSRRIAAEYAVDILSGNFDLDKTPDPIVVRGGKVILGQKRAAALMTIYGENWINSAKKIGFEVEEE